MDFFRPEYWCGYPFPSPGDLLNPRVKHRSLALQAYSSPAKPPGKPKNTGVGSLSILQQIFPTQELNQGLLHCRRIFYQLSYERSLIYILHLHMSSVQLISRVWLFCKPMDCSTPDLPVHHQLPEFTQTHVHWVSDAIQPSYPLSSPSPPAFNLSQNQGLFQWLTSLHQVAKVLEF